MPVLALYDPFGVDVPLNLDIIIIGILPTYHIIPIILHAIRSRKLSGGMGVGKKAGVKPGVLSVKEGKAGWYGLAVGPSVPVCAVSSLWSSENILMRYGIQSLRLGCFRYRDAFLYEMIITRITRNFAKQTSV